MGTTPACNVTDGQGRCIYILEMADALTASDEELEAMTSEEFTEWHENVWRWKQQPLGVFGPFRSVEETETWMGQKGTFEEADDWQVARRTAMAGKGRQTARKPATKFAHLRKKMEKARIVGRAGKKQRQPGKP